MEFSSSDWPGFSDLYDRWADKDDPAYRQGRRRRRGQLPLSGRKHPPLPATRGIPPDDRRRRLRPRRGRADARRARLHSQRAGRFDHQRHPSLADAQMGADARPPWRTHRDRAGSADSAASPAACARSPGSARAFRATPDYAKALQEIGPAAIKLGQTLSTRPDLVGERAAENLSQLQDDLPPAPFAAIKQTIEQSFEGAARKPLFRIRRSARRRRLDRPGPPRRHHRGPRSRGQGAPPAHRRGIRAGNRDLRMGGGTGRAHGRRARAACGPRLVVAHFKQWTARELDLQREARFRVRAPREHGRRARLLHSRDRLAAHRAARADARMARRNQAQRSRRADRGRPGLPGARRDARARLPSPGRGRRFLSRRPAPWQFVRAVRRAHRGNRLRDHGPDRPAGPRMARRDPLRPHHRATTAASPKSISRRNMFRRITASRNSPPPCAPPASRSAASR